MAQDIAVSAAIIDRTFSQLDAAAERLLAPWAGRAMRYFTGWKHDSVGNFLNVRCPKLICQDDGDKIIANSASLKTGVALRLELGVTFYGVAELSYDYLVAEAAGVPPPNSDMPIPKIGNMLLESHIMHLYSCLRYIGKCTNTAFVMEYSGHSFVTDYVAEDKGEVEEGGEPDENWNMVQPESSDAKTGFLGSDPKLWLQVWRTIAQTDGLTGTSLSGSMKSYDDFRGWICSFVVWAPYLLAQHPLSCEKFDSVQTVSHRLDQLSKLHSTLSSDPYFSYTVSFFKYLEKRTATSVSQSALHPETSSGNLLPLSCGHNAKFLKPEKEALKVFLEKHGLLEPVEAGRRPSHSHVEMV